MKPKSGKHKPQVIWSDQAKEAVRAIYLYYKEKSPQGAQALRSELLSAPTKVYFAKQYQVDEINPKYRRIIVRDFKILYKESDHIIQVLEVVSTRRSPRVLKKS